MGADVDEMIDPAPHSGSHLIGAVRPKRKGKAFEARAIVVLEDARHQMTDRMVAEVFRKVPDPDSL
jgi:sigma54-dependent transcription regulator